MARAIRCRTDDGAVESGRVLLREPHERNIVEPDRAGTPVLELHLYDSYGEGDPRGKLLGALLKHAGRPEKLSMTAGEQRLHLVHIDDIAKGFSQACKQVVRFDAGERRIFRLPSRQSITLRQLVSTLNSISPDQPVHIDWGTRPYRAREVYQPWEDASILPDWAAKIDLTQGLTQLISSHHLMREQNE